MNDANIPANAQWIDNRADLDAWLKNIDGSIAVDTEFMRTNTFFAKLALIQIAHEGRYALIDPLAVPFDTALADMDHAKAPLWIMHSPGEDLEVLAPLLPGGPGRLFDTQLAAAFTGMGPSVSYRALVEAVTGVQLEKGETRSNWLQRPLTESQHIYATLDVVHLHAVHQHLQQQLEQRDRVAWFQADCERLKQRAGERNGNDQPQHALRGAADWPRERQALLRRLLHWRESTARELDCPRPWLLQDAHIMSLVQDPPADNNGLMERTRGQRALRGPQRNALLDLLHKPVSDTEIEATAPIPAPLDGEGKKALKAMKNDINSLAESLDLPAGLLAPRKHLEAFISSGNWPRALEGWRHELLHDRLTVYLPN